MVIGAGPAGLACAACLKDQGAEVEILERADCVGSSWHGHYDRLHLHTVRQRSGLPRMAMPARFGKFPSRVQMIEYLESYAAHFGLEPRFGVSVAAARPSGDTWCVTHSAGETFADAVVFATGLNGTPFRAPLPGLESFPGPVLHSSDYKGPTAFAGQRVLVVGFGNSGGDIALDLAENGAHPILSVRGPVNILPHDLFGVPITSLGGLRKVLPYRWADAITAPILRAKIGRPEDYGLQSAGKGPAAQVIEDGRVPLIDIGTLGAIRAGKIETRPGIERSDGAEVSFGDGRADVVDAILLATGYRVDLRDMLPDTPQALDAAGRPRASGAPGPMPGLYFCSYRASADGQLRQTGIEAQAIADAVIGA
ncbi:putative monooxygenase [Candidatus Rhodobacter oscarellae]|uniref:Putative monooxygenase n=1 Tax=Candidatus Rhodobacter oscarellae TaxID=1675527 RepID=A0A0J9E3Q5_9RHOB|nr:putative monooxygenase [Candidatus Rhodobacter lobularis]